MDCETDCLANGVSLSVLTVTIQSMTDVVSFFFFTVRSGYVVGSHTCLFIWPQLIL